MSPLVLGLAVLPFWVGPVRAQEWAVTRVTVVPGESVGPVKLRAKLGEDAKKFLGTASRSAPPTSDAPGFAIYGKGDSRDLVQGVRLKFADPKNPDLVTSIDVKGIRASTADGLFLGGSASTIPKKFPIAQKDANVITGQPEWTIPGLVTHLAGDKISEFSVEPSEVSRWRFLELSVVAGQSVGPVSVGKAIPADLIEKWGPPTFQQAPKRTAFSGIMRWSLPGQEPSRMIEVLMHDGVRPRVVTQVRLRGVTAMTDRQIKLGDNYTAVRQIYPQGKEGILPRIELPTWRVPGLTFVMRHDRLFEIQVFKDR